MCLVVCNFLDFLSPSSVTVSLRLSLCGARRRSSSRRHRVTTKPLRYPPSCGSTKMLSCEEVVATRRNLTFFSGCGGPFCMSVGPFGWAWTLLGRCGGPHHPKRFHAHATRANPKKWKCGSIANQRKMDSISASSGNRFSPHIFVL